MPVSTARGDRRLPARLRAGRRWIASVSTSAAWAVHHAASCRNRSCPIVVLADKVTKKTAAVSGYQWRRSLIHHGVSPHAWAYPPYTEALVQMPISSACVAKVVQRLKVVHQQQRWLISARQRPPPFAQFVVQQQVEPPSTTRIPSIVASRRAWRLPRERATATVMCGNLARPGTPSMPALGEGDSRSERDLPRRFPPAWGFETRPPVAQQASIRRTEGRAKSESSPSHATSQIPVHDGGPPPGLPAFSRPPRRS